MLEQAWGVHDSMPTGIHATAAVLDDDVMAAICEANLGFLALVADGHATTPQAAVFGLPAEVAAAVGALDVLGRRAVASCPYTLFNLRFDDGEFWSALARDKIQDGGRHLTDAATFARTAVFLAWHLVRGREQTPQLVMAMTAPVCAALSALPLSALDLAATRVLPVLEARFAEHPRFWPKLVEAAVPLGRPRADSARLLGLQLLAAAGLSPGRPPLAGLPTKP